VQLSPTHCFHIQAAFYILLVLKIILVFHLRLEKKSLERSEQEREVTPTLVLEFERTRLLEAYTLLCKNLDVDGSDCYCSEDGVFCIS